METPLHKHEYDRKLTSAERKEIAAAFGWIDVGGVRDNLVGCRPIYDSAGNHDAWMDEQRVPSYDYDTLRFVRSRSNVKDEQHGPSNPPCSAISEDELNRLMAPELQRLREENRALRKMAANDSWSKELQDALDAIPLRFIHNDYWVNGIARMAAALDSPTKS